ncbi:MAG: 4-hydroxy-tetrahydrodipicolinate synthase [Armatimonadetes bacterium]|nr:4-hydroxy-tetrahydrodipicolinate synthase [Armatimonadota bacterium]
MWGSMMTAMVTPFGADERVDHEAAGRVVRHLIDTGSTSILVSGTTGESPTLTHDEKIELTKTVIDAVGGEVPVLIGTGSNDTRATVALTAEMTELGVDGIMLVTPYYNKPCQRGLIAHFTAAAAATDKPVMIYNIEARTARNILPATIGTLARDVPNIVAVKEASGNINQFAAVANATPDGFVIYSGNDSDTPAVMACGGVGVVSVASHVAGRTIRAMMDAYWAGDWNLGRALYLKLMPLVEALFPASSVSPAPVKAALAMIGVPCGGLRLPLVDCDDQVKAALAAALKGLDLL